MFSWLNLWLVVQLLVTTCIHADDEMFSLEKWPSDAFGQHTRRDDSNEDTSNGYFNSYYINPYSGSNYHGYRHIYNHDRPDQSQTNAYGQFHGQFFNPLAFLAMKHADDSNEEQETNWNRFFNMENSQRQITDHSSQDNEKWNLNWRLPGLKTNFDSRETTGNVDFLFGKVQGKEDSSEELVLGGKSDGYKLTDSQSTDEGMGSSSQDISIGQGSQGHEHGVGSDETSGQNLVSSSPNKTPCPPQLNTKPTTATRTTSVPKQTSAKVTAASRETTPVHKTTTAERAMPTSKKSTTDRARPTSKTPTTATASTHKSTRAPPTTFVRTTPARERSSSEGRHTAATTPKPDQQSTTSRRNQATTATAAPSKQQTMYTTATRKPPTRTTTKRPTSTTLRHKPTTRTTTKRPTSTTLRHKPTTRTTTKRPTSTTLRQKSTALTTTQLPTSTTLRQKSTALTTTQLPTSTTLRQKSTALTTTQLPTSTTLRQKSTALTTTQLPTSTTLRQKSTALTTTQLPTSTTLRQKSTALTTTQLPTSTTLRQKSTALTTTQLPTSTPLRQKSTTTKVVTTTISTTKIPATATTELTIKTPTTTSTTTTTTTTTIKPPTSTTARTKRTSAATTVKPSPRETTSRPSTTTTTTSTPLRPSTTSRPVVPDICLGVDVIDDVGYKKHWSDCGKFLQCVLAPDGGTAVLIRTCTNGTLWDQSTKSCIQAELVDCSHDPCQVVGLERYPSTTNCGSYWVCQDRKSKAACCPPKHSYDKVKGCIPDPQCLEECKNGPIIQDVCDRRAVQNKPLMFEQYTEGKGWTLTPCAPGTAYSEISCQCSGQVGRLSPEIECLPELYIPFTTDVKDESGHNNYLQVDGVKVVDGTGYFDGKSLIRVPRFSNLDFGDTFLIKLRFKEEGGKGASGGLPQALVANGDCNQPSSLYLVTDHGQLDVGLQTQEGMKSSVSIPSNATGWKETVLMYDKNVLLGSLNGISHQSLFSGSLKPSKCALQIGRGTEFSHFHGYMDDITVYLCRPKGF